MTGKDIIKITLNLVIVYLIGGFILAFVYANASPKIFKNAEEAEKKALKQLMPEADDVNEKWVIGQATTNTPNILSRKKAEILSDTSSSLSARDIQAISDTFIATDKDFVVQKISILHHGETPGLGDEIRD